VAHSVSDVGIGEIPMIVARTKSSGFTMIELLIAVAIIGIISAVAFPSYSEYVRKTRRSDGHLALLNQIQSMERCKSTAFTYTGCALSSTTSNENYYDLTLASTASTFTVTATAKGAQTSDTGCTVLTLNDLGQQSPATCWD